MKTPHTQKNNNTWTDIKRVSVKYLGTTFIDFCGVLETMCLQTLEFGASGTEASETRAAPGQSKGGR